MGEMDDGLRPEVSPIGNLHDNSLALSFGCLVLSRYW